MPEFDYIAIDEQGRRQRARLVAQTQAQAQRMLAERRLQVVSLKEGPSGSSGSNGQSGAGAPSGKVQIGTEQLAGLLDELATLVAAGVPLAEAVDTLSRGQAGAHPLTRVLVAIRGGESFSEAMSAAGLTVQPFVAQLLRAGEATGELGRALRAAANHLEAELQFARDARNALLYPMVLVGSGLLATLVMFVFVVPRFAGILSNPKADLPLVSQWVLGLGLWLTQNQVLVGSGLVALSLGAVSAWRQPGVKAAMWSLISQMPLLGRWAWHAEVARWAALFGVLLESRVPLLSALAQANETWRRKGLRLQAAQVLADVRGGKLLSRALADQVLLDGAALNLIRVGERAGTLPQAIATLGRIHTQHSQQRLKRFLILLEPLTILLISVVLGGIMISVMLAITSLTNVL